MLNAVNKNQVLQIQSTKGFARLDSGGSGGIRTHEPKKDYRISSAARYDHFDTLPYDYRIIISVA